MVKEHIVFITDPKLDHINPERHSLPVPVIKMPNEDTAEPIRTNPTILPDSFMRSFTPIILIRHPARVLPSYIRVIKVEGNSEWDQVATASSINFRCSRHVFDYYRALCSTSDATLPVVIDGDDLVNNTKGVVKKLCDAIGLDESLVTYEWEKRESDGTPGDSKFRAKILGSTGVIRDEVCSYWPSNSLYPKCATETCDCAGY
jgi:hypothetical protein